MRRQWGSLFGARRRRTLAGIHRMPCFPTRYYVGDGN